MISDFLQTLADSAKKVEERLPECSPQFQRTYDMCDRQIRFYMDKTAHVLMRAFKISQQDLDSINMQHKDILPQTESKTNDTSD